MEAVGASVEGKRKRKRGKAEANVKCKEETWNGRHGGDNEAKAADSLGCSRPVKKEKKPPLDFNFSLNFYKLSTNQTTRRRSKTKTKRRIHFLSARKKKRDTCFRPASPR